MEPPEAPADRPQLPTRGSVAALLTLALLVSTGEAHGQGAARALKLLGQFAMGVATSVAAEEARAWMRPERKPPGEGASQPSRNEELSRSELQPRAPRASGYRFRVVWQAHDGSYSGTLAMRGGAGTLRVETPTSQIVDQDMRAEAFNGKIFLIGSNPRYANSPLQAFDYSPDGFTLAQLPGGEWTITATCDAQGVCARVTVVEASVF